MGGRPVLGSFSMCESELLQHRRGLNATASPAAQEVARLRSGSTSPADALPAGPSGQAEASPAWLVSARHSLSSYLGFPPYITAVLTWPGAGHACPGAHMNLQSQFPTISLSEKLSRGLLCLYAVSWPSAL